MAPVKPVWIAQEVKIVLFPPVSPRAVVRSDENTVPSDVTASGDSYPFRPSIVVLIRPLHSSSCEVLSGLFFFGANNACHLFGGSR